MNDWQRHFVYLYQNSIFLDLTISAGIGDFRKEFQVHRIVVSIIPRIMEDLKNMSITKSTLEYPHIDSEIMKLIIQYVYTGSLQENNSESLKTSRNSEEEPSSLSTNDLDGQPTLPFRHAIGLFEATKYFKMYDLMDSCALILYELADKTNSLWILQAAIGAGHESLIQEICAMICENGNIILKRTEIEDVNLKTLEQIIKQDKLVVSSERKVFYAVFRWGIAECQRQEKDPNDHKEIRRVTDTLLKLVRFRLLSYPEFQKYVLPTRILKKAELISLFSFFMVNENERVEEDIYFIDKPRIKIQQVDDIPRSVQSEVVPMVENIESEDSQNSELSESVFEKSLLSQPSH